MGRHRMAGVAPPDRMRQGERDSRAAVLAAVAGTQPATRADVARALAAADGGVRDDPGVAALLTELALELPALVRSRTALTEEGGPADTVWELTNDGWTELGRAQRRQLLGRATDPGMLARLEAPACVLDGGGTIIWVNPAWRAFGRQNDAQEALCGVGISYLGVCDAAAQAACDGAREVGDGLRACLARQLDRFTHEYSCDAPWERRRFLLLANPMPEGAGAAVVHHRTA